MRRVFLVMSVNALPYAKACIRTMLANSIDPIKLHIISDNREEQSQLREETAEFVVAGTSLIEVITQEEVAEIIANRYPDLLHLQLLHSGHPCWRKIIDPIVLSEPDEEIIVVDPDLFFPNRYNFERTLETGVMMMRQGPNCLFPPQAVRTAFDAGIRLANHVDIGVAQMRAGLVDLEWLDAIARDLQVKEFTEFMHIEAIVWSAIAMRYGGRHLDSRSWRCWEKGYVKRLAVAGGIPGRWTLKLEPMRSLKCIHVSGPSKWWVKESLEAGILKEYLNDATQPTEGLGYKELDRQTYEREQTIKNMIWKVIPGGRQP